MEVNINKVERYAHEDIDDTEFSIFLLFNSLGFFTKTNKEKIFFMKLLTELNISPIKDTTIEMNC